MKKYCSRCDSTQPIENFYLTRSAKSGHDSICKKCRKESNTKFNPKNNPMNNPRRPRGYNAPYLAKYLKIKWHPLVADEELWEFHRRDGMVRCWNCGAEESKTKRLNRDHNHKTGWLRGLLCWDCNRNLPTKYCDGTLEEARAYLVQRNCFTDEYIERCLYYLENPPYFQMMELHRIERPMDGETHEEYFKRFPSQAPLGRLLEGSQTQLQDSL